MLNQINFLRNNYNFNGLYHFTDFSNLDTILNSGYLYSRNHCNQNQIVFMDGASSNIISNTKSIITNSVRFYFKEKSMTLYVNEGIKPTHESPHIPIPVYLIFNPSLLFEDYIMFTDGNARAYNTSINNTTSFFKSSIDWEAVFWDGPPNDLNDMEFKRKRQAEVLSKQPVSLNHFLDKIVFRSKADFKRYQFLYGHLPYNIEVNSNLFNNKNHYIVDYNTFFCDEVGAYKIKYTTSQKIRNDTYTTAKNIHHLKIYDNLGTIYTDSSVTFQEAGSWNGFSITIPLNTLLTNRVYTYEISFFDILSVQDILK